MQQLLIIFILFIISSNIYAENEIKNISDLTIRAKKIESKVNTSASLNKKLQQLQSFNKFLKIEEQKIYQSQSSDQLKLKISEYTIALDKLELEGFNKKLCKSYKQSFLFYFTPKTMTKQELQPGSQWVYNQLEALCD